MQGRCIIPIQRFTEAHDFPPEALRGMNDALEVASMALQIEPSEETRRETLAQTIVRLAASDPSLRSAALSEQAVTIHSRQ
jgi:hypothetical protein